MIGGYIYRALDPGLDARVRERIEGIDTRIDAWDCGYLFHEQSFKDQPTTRLISEDIIAVSEDLLVAAEPGGGYRPLELSSDFVPRLARDAADAFDAISSEFRMAVVQKQGDDVRLYLASNRAGSGRIYFHAAESGVVFSSDLRFLLKVVSCDVDPLGVHAILKFGAAPDPLTISSNVGAVPAAHFLSLDVATGEQDLRTYFRIPFACEWEPAAGGEAFLTPAKEALTNSSRFLAARNATILLSGGIDSSLYGGYLSEAAAGPVRGFYCQFGDSDPELPYARQIAERIRADLHIARMGKPDALGVLRDVVRWTDHPFSDFSSIPIAFLLDFARERMGEASVLVECNGGDDCFGFPDLGSESKFRLKHRFPRLLKAVIASLLRGSGYWKWDSRGGLLARLAALADTHERSVLDYFLVLAPMSYLGLKDARARDRKLAATMEDVFSRCGERYEELGFEARTTVRQLMHVNSRRWAAKALSVGESLGVRVVYPFIWREVLVAQGAIPWSAKIRDGVVKWPLKRLLEEFVPGPFIYRKKSGFVPPFASWLTDAEFNGKVKEILLDDGAVVTESVPRKVLEELLADALAGRELKHAIMNFLWGALFLEMWLAEHARG